MNALALAYRGAQGQSSKNCKQAPNAYNLDHEYAQV